MHTQVDMAETCTKIFSMKWQFHQYTICLLKIAAYCSIKLFSFNKTLKICDLQQCVNKCMFQTETLEYKDDAKIFEFFEL